MTTEKLYLTEKEAAYRYGYSRQWFQRARWSGENCPPFRKVGNGKILYSLKETDAWFANHGLRASTSQNGGAK